MKCLVEGCETTPFRPYSFCTSHWHKMPPAVRVALFSCYFSAAAEKVAAAWLSAT
jgi:hypothetical protein